MLVCIYASNAMFSTLTLRSNSLTAVSCNVSLSGGSSCRWYINPNVPEAKNLMARWAVRRKYYYSCQIFFVFNYVLRKKQTLLLSAWKPCICRSPMLNNLSTLRPNLPQQSTRRFLTSSTLTHSAIRSFLLHPNSYLYIWMTMKNCLFSLHIHVVQKIEWLVTVRIMKIDSSWWYNSCKRCLRTARPHGDS